MFAATVAGWQHTCQVQNFIFADILFMNRFPNLIKSTDRYKDCLYTLDRFCGPCTATEAKQ